MVRCCAIFAARTPDTGNTTGRPLAAAVRWLCRNLTAYNSGSVTPSDAGGCRCIIIAFSLATYGFAKPPIGSAGKGTYLLCWVFSCQGAGERTISAKEKSVGEWSVPPYDLLLFLPHCTSCEATQFLSVLSMLYENWVCGL